MINRRQFLIDSAYKMGGIIGLMSIGIPFAEATFIDQLKMVAKKKTVSGPPGSITLTNSSENTIAAAGTSETVTHTVGSGGYRVLVVVVMWDNDNNEAITSVVWDAAGANESMTEIGTGYETLDDAAVHMFYLIAPTTGTDKLVTVTWDGNLLHGCSIAAFSLEGAAQSSPVRDEAGDAGQTVSGCLLTASLTGAISGDFIIFGSSIEAANRGIDWTASGFSTTELSQTTDSDVASFSAGYGTADSSGENVVANWDGADTHMAVMAAAIKVAS